MMLIKQFAFSLPLSFSKIAQCTESFRNPNYLSRMKCKAAIRFLIYRSAISQHFKIPAIFALFKREKTVNFMFCLSRPIFFNNI